MRGIFTIYITDLEKGEMIESMSLVAGDPQEAGTRALDALLMSRQRDIKRNKLKPENLNVTVVAVAPLPPPKQEAAKLWLPN